MATPICAFAAAIARSAEAISGRRCNTSLGRAERNRRHLRVEHLRRDGELRRGYADQCGDRMFELRALIQQQLRLHLGRVEQRLLLQHVEPRHRTELMLGAHVIERLLLQFHRLVQHVDLGVELAQREIVGGEVRGQHQPRVGEVVGRLLRRRRRAFHLTTYPAE
ncbi:hypothetical protein GGD41_001741 [Paraburkholderia bryophila]|uniref:Uncharacterized protein n=1 Tax=Paraburkholderia bryophila TaxID=420952 RepID=A0A7Y9W6F6_9BURK|nr:hypothetical protein [Paraburkholderia bryophila]